MNLKITEELKVLPTLNLLKSTTFGKKNFSGINFFLVPIFVLFSAPKKLLLCFHIDDVINFSWWRHQAFFKVSDWTEQLRAKTDAAFCFQALPKIVIELEFLWFGTFLGNFSEAQAFDIAICLLPVLDYHLALYVTVLIYKVYPR